MINEESVYKILFGLESIYIIKNLYLWCFRINEYICIECVSS